MEEISVIGIDLAKRVFKLCAMTGSGAIAWEKRLRRAALIKFLEDEAPRCLVGLEACGGAHHWARGLVARGFSVKLMPPKAVKAYREGVHKNDRRIRQRVQTANQLRGLLNEFGIVLLKGHRLLLVRLRELIPTAEFAMLPVIVKELVQPSAASSLSRPKRSRRPVGR